MTRDVYSVKDLNEIKQNIYNSIKFTYKYRIRIFFVVLFFN